jgi:RNA polymerase sigma factor (sigma-70 family)
VVDQADFTQTVMPHLDEAYNLTRWRTGSAADSEDVVQESLMKAFRFFGGFRGPEARPWLLTIVRRTCFTWLAANRPRQLVFTEDDAAVEAQNQATVVTLHPKAAETPESLLADKETTEELNAAVEALPAPFREARDPRPLLQGDRCHRRDPGRHRHVTPRPRPQPPGGAARRLNPRGGQRQIVRWPHYPWTARRRSSSSMPIWMESSTFPLPLSSRRIWRIAPPAGPGARKWPN